MKIIFFSLFLLLFGAIHFLARSRMVMKMHIGAKTKRWFSIFLALNYLGNIGYVLARYIFEVPKALYALLSMSIGVTFILFLAMLLYEILHLLQRHTPFHKERRRLFKIASDAAFLGAGAVVTGVSAYEGTKRPVVKNVIVKQDRFDGKSYRIVQISDMHIGGLIEKEFVEESVRRINELRPDVVVITGDLTDLPIERISGAVDELKNLRSRFGTFYVPGNHEYFHGLEETLDYLEKIGIEILGNRAVNLGPFWIVGVYDIFGIRYGSYSPNIKEATVNIPQKAATLLLAHQPRFIYHLNGFNPSLMLSGHTHGGQIWPFGYLVKLQQPYLEGLHRLGKRRHIYVNSGIGFWGPPMRLGTEAEITLIEWS